MTIQKEIREAIREGNTEQVVAIIGSDKDRLNMMTVFGTWLHVAASFGKLNIVKRLIEMGADVNAYGGIGGGSPLREAASDGHINVVKYLVEHGAKLDVSEPERNPLFGAIYGGHIEIAKLLIDAGIDTSVKYTGESMKNMDASAFAHERGQTEIEKLLTSCTQNEGAGNAPGTGRHLSAGSHDDIIDHMTRHFGPVQTLALTDILPTSGVTINVIPASSKEKSTILFTTGMSDLPQTVPPGQEEYEYTELFIRLPAGWPLDANSLGEPANYWPIEWLKQIASYPHDNDTWLGGPLTILSNGEPPEPLAPNTDLSCLMLMREEELNPVRCRDGKLITLYSLMPLYTEERDLEKNQGASVLFDYLEEHGIELIADPKRTNVVMSK